MYPADERTAVDGQPTPENLPKRRERSRKYPLAEPVPAAKIKGKPGRKPTKKRLSLRIDAAYYDLAHKEAAQHNRKITDVVEHGIALDLAQSMQDTPTTRHVRFMLPKATVAEQENLLRCLILQRADDRQLNPWARAMRSQMLTLLGMVKEEDPQFRDAFRSFRMSKKKATCRV